MSKVQPSTPAQVHPQIQGNIPVQPQPNPLAQQMPNPQALDANNQLLREVYAINDDSIVDLEYEKNLTKIDPDKMKQKILETHATRPTGEFYNCDDVLCSFNPGSHSCTSSSEKSDATKFGVGIVLYFKFVKHLICFFFIFAILSIPAYIVYLSAYSTYKTSKDDSYLDLLSATTIGSLGMAAGSCGIAKHPSAASTAAENEIYFQCTAGKIADIDNIQFGLVKTGSSCSFIEETDLNTDCNVYSSTVFNSALSSCVGESECVVSIPTGFFKTGDSTCTSLYSSNNVYMKVSCTTTSLRIWDKYDIEKSNLAFAIAIIDAVIILLFLLMIYSLNYAQKAASANVLKKAYSASAYTVEMRNLPQDLTAEALAAKLWIFLDRKLGNRVEHRVIDVQVVLPNDLIALSRKTGNVIRKKNALMREYVQLFCPGYQGKEIDLRGIARMMVSLREQKFPQLRVAERRFKEIKDLAIKKQKLLLEIQRLRTNKDTKIISAFVTFNSILARNRVLDVFASSPLDRCARIACNCCYDRDVTFLGKVLRAKPADDPASILWENLGKAGIYVVLRRGFSLFLTLSLWVVSGTILLISTYYKNEFKEQYPVINCDGLNPTREEAATDYNLGDSQSGLLTCYCSADVFGRLNDVFTTSNNRQLCQDWFQSKVIETGVTFGIVFIVLLVNYFIQFVFQGLSKFEKHSTLNKQISSRVIKTFVGQFLNTGLLILLINAKIPSISFWQGKFRDLTPLWYNNVGSTLISTMIINVVTIPSIKVFFVLFQMIQRCCDRKCGDDERVTSRKTQKAYEELYMGPEFIIDFRYSQILTLTFVCFLYSGGMPLLYITSFAQLVITYYFDKFFLLRICKLPKNYDEKLENVVRPTMYYIIILHLIFAIFMYGNSSIFEQKLFNNSNFSGTVDTITTNMNSATQSVASKFFTRMKSEQNIILTVILALCVSSFVIKGFLLGFLKRTLFAVFAKDEDYARKQANINRLARNNNGQDPDRPFFSVLNSDDIASLVRLTKVTIKTTQNEDLLRIYKHKVTQLVAEYKNKKIEEDENRVDPNINFIGFFTYDVRLNPMYKAQFAMEEQLDDETVQ